ncbi:MAG: hypothetical protein ACK5KU_06965 [Beutenbergiaceae bacterium]
MSERDQIYSFFRSINHGDMIALGPRQAGFDQGEGHEAAREVARQRGIAEPNWVFWHRQSAWVFDGAGDLTAPLVLHWGGRHDRVAQVLATIPAPLRIVDNGPDGAFQIASDEETQRRDVEFPDVADTAAVKDRIKAITAQRRHDVDWSEAEIAWMNSVLSNGDRSTQGYVVRWLAGSDQLSEDAFAALVADWKRIYVKAPTDVLVWDFLRTLRRRQDQRLEEIIDLCMARPRYTFSAGVSSFLAERADPADLPRLRQLALTPARYAHTPGNGTALRAWVAVTAKQEGRAVAEVAQAALNDPTFDAGARTALSKIATSAVQG